MRASPNHHVGLFIVSCSLFVFELLLTRLFSVVLVYHFAFFAVSIALFGLGAGAIFVQLFPKYYMEDTVLRQLTFSSLALGLAMLCPVYFLLRFNLMPRASLYIAGIPTGSLCFIFLLSALPFFWGGVITATLFKHFSRSISTLYFADLLGASVGSVATFMLLGLCSAPTAVLVDAILASFGSFGFIGTGRFWKSRRTLLVPSVAVCLFLVVLLGYHRATSAFDLKFAKGLDRSKDEFSKWNAISRVAVSKPLPPLKDIAIMTWGVSRNFHGNFPEMKWLDIDAQAGTFLTHFDGDWRSVAYVTQDPPSIVHRLKEQPETLIIGAGGGKDVLAALALGAKHVTAVELNPLIVNDVMLGRYREFTGGLYEDPRVTAVVSEGRSYLHSRRETYDIIQLAFVDTSAATSAGAYVLSENNLYTIEAFLEYLSHLKEGGILSATWVDLAELKGGTRLVSLAIAALKRLQIEDVERHLIVVMNTSRPNWTIVNVLMKRTPFTAEEENQIGAICQRLGFKIPHAPLHPSGTFISRLILDRNRETLLSSYPLNLSPPTDDRPFFFYQDRLAQLFESLRGEAKPGYIYGAGLLLLSRTLVVSLVLVLVFFFGPLLFLRRNVQAAQPPLVSTTLSYLFYFCCLGLGFMFLEITLIQRFLLFLGHPFYTLSVTLLALLLASGFGSLTTHFFSSHSPRMYVTKTLALLNGIGLAYHWLLPKLLKGFIGYPLGLKACLTLIVLTPLGFLMGMPLPLGVRVVRDRMGMLIPWAWGLNGAMSVLGSVLAMFIAMNFGYSATFLTGLGFYLLAYFLARLSF